MLEYQKRKKKKYCQKLYIIMREITKVKCFIQSKYYCKSIYKVYSVNSEEWTHKFGGGSWELLRRDHFQLSFKEWMRVWLVNKKGNTFMKENKGHLKMSQELLVWCALQLLRLLSCIQRMTQSDERMSVLKGVHYFVCYYFLPFWGLSFHLAYSFLCCSKAFKFH